MKQMLKNDVLFIVIIVILILIGKVFYNPVELGDELITFNTTYKIFNRKNDL